MPIIIPALVACFMGVMFTGIGSKGLQQQVSFVYLLLTRICLSGLQQMPSLIEERTIMKYDTSETLYSAPAFIIVGLAVDISISLIGAVEGVAILFAFSGVHWKYFGCFIEWALLDFFVFDSFFSLVAAVAPSLQSAQVVAIPFNSIFILFSGFVISKASAPSFLTWLFQVSPMGYAMQSIFCYMAKDFGPEGQDVIKLYGYEEGQETKGVILLSMIVCFRLLQVLALQYLNDIQR